MGDTPYSKSSEYYMALGKAIKRRKRKNEAKDNMKGLKVPTAIANDDLHSVIAENGFERGEHELYRNNRPAAVKRASDLVKRNEFEGYDKGIKYRDYALEKAVRRTKEKQKNGR